MDPGNGFGRRADPVQHGMGENRVEGFGRRVVKQVGFDKLDAWKLVPRLFQQNAEPVKANDLRAGFLDPCRQPANPASKIQNALLRLRIEKLDELG